MGEGSRGKRAVELRLERYGDKAMPQRFLRITMMMGTEQKLSGGAYGRKGKEEKEKRKRGSKRRKRGW
jgi:hypothetical protein